MARVGANGIGADHRAAANFAFGSSALFVFAALLYIDAFSIEHNARVTAPGGIEAYMQLNVTTLQARWEGRRAAQGPMLFAQFCMACAWFASMAPVSAMMAHLGGQTRSATWIVTSAFQMVAVITLLDMTFQAGTISLTDWVHSWPMITNADGSHAADGGFGAIQALEIAFLVGTSRTIWLFTMDELLLAVAWLTTAWLIYTARGMQQPFAAGFAHLAVAGALVNVLGFGLHIARFFAWTTFTLPAIMSSVVVYLIIMPTWLVWLGVQLKGRSEAVAYASSIGEKEVEMGQSGTGPAREAPIGGVITPDAV